MDPLGAFSLAAGVIAFVDFGGKLISTLSGVRHSDDGLPGRWSALVSEAQELSGHVKAANDTLSDLYERYPRQAEAFNRLYMDCAVTGLRLRSLVNELAACPGSDLKSLASQVLALAQGLRKRGDLRSLEERFSSIRQQTQLAVLMDDTAFLLGGSMQQPTDAGMIVLVATRDDVAALGNQKPANAGSQRGSKRPVSNINHGQQLPGATSQKSMADVLWDTMSAVLEFTGPAASIRPGSSPSDFPTPEMMDLNFPWLLQNNPPASAASSTTADEGQPTGFERRLADEAKTPFWITGKPASGKSTLMKFICTEPRVKKTLRLWSESLRLLTCDIYIWNPGPSMQKSQLGLLRTILYQILVQDPSLCQHATPKHYLFFQLPGTDTLDPPEMELLTKPDIQEYVQRRISSSRGFQELRRIEEQSVKDLESQIVEKAEGIFLWVVLVAESLLVTAQDDNNLRTIWKVFEAPPPGLEELYSSMRNRL
ncbi:hypothetical protein MAPG_06052 [Magnaporthiopsis poae ATCC 64411]|uniref:Nephrocystin 3-like N-terminal domain-containing protein n=1 Tax=Magnaporthiopsis poae (strain ATCC 64411 / 73-15) TaxID=644358 RepID=A0A0C4E108_MAGP6|nr:hypothetical protein MAPG_06052 [Magnaporthiopsis poae ATCC 64411]